jgi:Protein of unknown function (DUF3558)
VSFRTLVALAATLLVVLAGCTTRTQGNPIAGPAASSAPETTERTSTRKTRTGPPEADGRLADIKPCDLLDAGDRARLGLGDGKEETHGVARVCNWRHEGPTIRESYSVGVGLFDTHGLSRLNARNIQKLEKIGRHEAVSFTELSDDCGIALLITETSRVDFGAVGTDNVLGCEIPLQLATIIEPKLP